MKSTIPYNIAHVTLKIPAGLTKHLSACGEADGGLNSGPIDRESSRLTTCQNRGIGACRVHASAEEDRAFVKWSIGIRGHGRASEGDASRSGDLSFRNK